MDTIMLELGLSEQELDGDVIKHKKWWNKFFKHHKAEAKPTNCLYCQKEVSSFCNSHSIPAHCLKNIGMEGKNHTVNKLIDNCLMEDERGVNNTGVFQMICRDCDSKIFQEYENPQNYTLELPTQKMLAQIALKNYLYSIYKRLIETKMYEGIDDIQSYTNQLEISKLDLNEFFQGLQKAKRIIQKDKVLGAEYYLFYYTKLDYVVPIAFQDSITLAIDLNGNVVNDIYNFDPKYSTKELHVAVLPHENYSVVMMFIDEGESRYKYFCRQFNKLDSNDKLSVVNYLIFLYSENVVLSKTIPQRALNNERLKDISKQSNMLLAPGIFFLDEGTALKQFYSLQERAEIPNFLSKEYQINIGK